MTEYMELGKDIALVTGVIVAVLGVWSLNLIGMPGNWLIILVTFLYAAVMPADSRLDIGAGAFVGLVVLAGIGEAVEFLASALGASQAGGSKRGAALAMVGSLMGGFAGIFLGIGVPIPLIGPVIGALLFASIGALGGAILGEQWKGRDLDQSIRVGNAAFWGRLVGTVGKILLGAYMIMLVIIALAF